MQVEGTSEAHQRARKLRRQLTKPERLLWWALKGDKNRLPLSQAACGWALCTRLLLRSGAAVRGGGWRVARADRRHDQARDRYLERWGILTLRVPAGEVLTNLQGVVEGITLTAKARPFRQR